MLRISFNRSLSQPLFRTIAGTTPSIATTTYSSLKFPGKFVCISCQVRALASQARHRCGTRASGFLETIKRFEARVQLIEKRAADLEAQDTARKRLPNLELTEELQDQAYQALMTPGSGTATFLPKPEAVSEMLPPLIIKRLGDAAALVDTRTPLWGAVIGQLGLGGGFQGMDIADVNCLLLSMDLKSRVENALTLQEMMEKAGLEPDTLTYDLLMMAHAELGQPEEVKILFENLKKRGVPSTVFTFAHFLKACSLQSDVEGAGKAFVEMREAGIQPNLVVYTTLIQTCLNRREVSIAWLIFDLMKLKSRATAPDAYTFTLMLHACALEGESEKALNLFRDMTDRMKLKPTKETYHALIHSLAVRKDYYQEVWWYATKMRREGFEMSRRVLGTLIQACGKMGDLARARMLIRHMLGSGKEDIIPNTATYQSLFRAYANIAVQRRLVEPAEDEPSETSVPYVGPDTRLVKQEESFKEDTIPFSQKTVLGTRFEIVEEASRVMGWLCTVKPHLVDTQLVNAFLDTLCNKRYRFRLKKFYYTAYTDPKESDYLGSTSSNTEVEDLTPEPSISAPATATMDMDTNADINTLDRPPLRRIVPRNLYTFQIALESAFKHRDLSFARAIYNDRTKYLQTKQYLWYRESQRTRLDIKAECLLINILARCGTLGEAAAQLETICQKYKIYQADIKYLHYRALQLGDRRTLRVIRRWTVPDYDYALKGEGEAQDLSRTW